MKNINKRLLILIIFFFVLAMIFGFLLFKRNKDQDSTGEIINGVVKYTGEIIEIGARKIVFLPEGSEESVSCNSGRGSLFYLIQNEEEKEIDFFELRIGDKGEYTFQVWDEAGEKVNVCQILKISVRGKEKIDIQELKADFKEVTENGIRIVNRETQTEIVYNFSENFECTVFDLAIKSEEDLLDDGSNNIVDCLDVKTLQSSYLLVLKIDMATELIQSMDVHISDI